MLEAVLDEYLKHHDPVKKASRGLVRRAKSKATWEAKNETNSRNSENSIAATELLRTRKNHLLAQSSADLKKTVHTKSTPIRESDNKAKNATTTQKRVPLTAEQKHVVFHRDQGRCTHLDEDGKRCGSDRWVDVHHVIEVSRGGTNEPSNLTLLCSFHHDLVHQLSLPIDFQFNWIREPRSRYS